jgi:tRNA-2-methylthio-N6-dimethylallyladenosine synthase
VGFPGETETQFQDTVSLLKEVPYENIFAFAYSPRPMTKAARFEDQVPDEIKNRRLNEIIDLHNRIAFPRAKKYEGLVLKVLVERYDAETGRVQGRSTQNKSVHFAGGEDLIGQTVDVRIERAFPITLRGERVQ